MDAGRKSTDCEFLVIGTRDASRDERALVFQARLQEDERAYRQATRAVGGQVREVSGEC
jgi:hypothetical protein